MDTSFKYNLDMERGYAGSQSKTPDPALLRDPKLYNKDKPEVDNFSTFVLFIFTSSYSLVS